MTPMLTREPPQQVTEGSTGMKPNEQTKDAIVEPAATDALMSELKVLAADVERLLAATSAETGRQFARGRTRADASLKAALARVADMRKATMARAQTAGHATDEYVHSNAWQVVAIGAAAGFLLGCLIGRRGPVDS